MGQDRERMRIVGDNAG